MLDLFISSAYAQEAAAAQPNALSQFIPFILVFGIFYFMMIRPQKKKLQEEQAMLSALTKGDDIYTKSGILGKIHGLTDRVATLEVGEGTKIKVLRSQIAGKSDTILKPATKK